AAARRVEVTGRLPSWGGAGSDLRVPLTCVALEARLALAEPELDVAGGTVAMFGELDVDHLAIHVDVLARLLLLPPQEHDEVGVLLDCAGLAQVRQAGLLRLAHLRLA